MKYFALMFALLMLVPGCGQRSTLRFPHADDLPFAGIAAVDPETGDTLTRRQFHRRLAEAEVILVGETYASKTSNLVEQLILIALIQNFDDVALSLEMLNRDQQEIVNAWMAGEIPTMDFVAQADVADWGRENSWMSFYQPLLDWARMAGWTVVAANAPEDVISVVWNEGLAGLGDMEPGDPPRYAIPQATEIEGYKERFTWAMEDQDTDDIGFSNMFDAQRVWDATMADSILKALEDTDKVVHITGRFHIEHRGGTVLEILARRPETRVLVLSITEPDAKVELLEPDVADLVLIPR
ncbi:MAG: ChaN family lipoprotein [Candidatus Sumerlaeia bacterium]|nr:ChaN family lipoprotein [Candidatus Sumerlaeia bacterium]